MQLLEGRLSLNNRAANTTSSALQPITDATSNTVNTITNQLNSEPPIQSDYRQNIVNSFEEVINTRELTSITQSGDTEALEFRSDYMGLQQRGELSSLGNLVDTFA
ncbi:MAG: hypothetical protein HUJ29_07350 [Gammaproteobacteria bacterium]|nr:hypothetical protein [Gammaproteobacteria bacterium]